MIIHRWPTLTISTSIVKRFLSSPARGISHFFTDTKNTTYTTERVKEKRTNNHGLRLAPSARREKFVTLLCSSPCICRLSRACIRAKCHKVTRNADSSSHVDQPRLWIHTSQQSASPDICWLLFPVYFSVLLSSLFWFPLCSASFTLLSASPTSVDSGTFLLSSSSGLEEISRAIIFSRQLFSRAKTDKGIFWLALTHTRTTNADHRVTFQLLFAPIGLPPLDLQLWLLLLLFRVFHINVGW